MNRVLLGFESAQSVSDWITIDDRVMGGVSASAMRHDPAGHAVFAGTVSLDRNGGFASVRARPRDAGVHDIKTYLLDVCGDGKRYKLNLRSDEDFDGLNYQAGFDAPAGIWTVVRLPVESFKPTFRGRMIADAPPLNPATVRQIGLMIADRQVGAFALAIRTIAVA